MKNKEILNEILTDLSLARTNCNKIKLNHENAIKLVEARSDILRAIQKLEKLYEKES